MTDGLVVDLCGGCRRAWFPRRYICPFCARWLDDRTLATGLRIRELTQVGDVVYADGDLLLPELQDAGPAVLARIWGEAGPGDAVPLHSGEHPPGTDLSQPLAWIPTNDVAAATPHNEGVK